MSSSESLDRTGLGAAVACYLMWGVFPLLFHQMSIRDASPWEIVGWRTVFAAPISAGLVLFAGQGEAFLSIVRTPRLLAMLALSAVLIGVNWTVYVWAVDRGQTLSASLGYFINPLVNAALGAWIFREPISRAGRWALGLATVGVLVQAAALGAPPWVALVLAVSFASYGAVRKRVQADAQVGLLVECLLLAPFAIFLLFILSSGAHLKFGQGFDITALLLFCGPMTVAPLGLFAVAARRLPLNIVGFIQFLTPTLQFACGLLQGERLTLPSLIAFSFIWTGAAIFAVDLVRRLRRESADERLAGAS
jgi:chloramphenicol-sensitive protein RarD